MQDFGDLIIPDEWNKWFNENCVNCPNFDICWPEKKPELKISRR